MCFVTSINSPEKPKGIALLTLIMLIAVLLGLGSLLNLAKVHYEGQQVRRQILRDEIEALQAFIRKEIDCEATWATASISDPATQCLSSSRGDAQTGPYLSLRRKTADGSVKYFGEGDDAGRIWGTLGLRASCSQTENSLVVRATPIVEGSWYGAGTLVFGNPDFISGMNSRRLEKGREKIEPLCPPPPALSPPPPAPTCECSTLVAQANDPSRRVACGQTNLCDGMMACTPGGFVDIGTEAELRAMVSGATPSQPNKYRLAQNITLGSFQTLGSRRYIVLDGNGFTVTGGDILPGGGSNNNGFFSELEDSIVMNLVLKGFNISPARNIGVLAGALTGSCVHNVSVQDSFANSSSIGSPYLSTGGIAGTFFPTTTGNAGVIVDSSFVGSGSGGSGGVTGRGGKNVMGMIGGVGGLVGLMGSGRIVRSSVGCRNITGEKLVGGVVGSVVEKAAVSLIDVCAQDTHVVGSESVGGIVGSLESGSLKGAYFSAGRVVAGQGSRYVGGLIGSIEGTSPVEVDNVGVRTEVSGYQKVGGIVGKMENGTLSNSFFEGGSEIAGSYDIGGLAGYMDCSQCSLMKSYNRGRVLGTTNSGGAIGYLKAGELHQVYSSGSVVHSGSSNGGLIGRRDPASTAVFNSYWDQSITPFPGAGGVGLTTAQMKTASSYVGWDFSHTWELPPGDYPKLRSLPILP